MTEPTNSRPEALSACGKCGQPVPPDAPEGLCGACLLAFALEEDEPDDEGEKKPSPGLVELGDYELLGKLGQGGMGAVYRARHRRLGREVAIKFILLGKWASPGQQQRFEAEVKSIAGLDHPNIVPVYETGYADEQQFFSMKFVDGGSLTDWIGRDHIDHETLIEVLVKVARAVDYAHGKGVLHRDLKPANVLLDKSGEPFLSDFGLAANLEEGRLATLTAGMAGTPHYMAPEMVTDDEPVTVAADVYGLGAILYEVLIGTPPFYGSRSLLDVAQKVRATEPKRPCSHNPAIEHDLETICLHAMAKEPGRRYRSAADFADDLQRYQRGEPINAREVSTFERGMLWARRRPAVASMLAFCTAAAMALLTTLVVSNRRISEANDTAQQNLSETRAVLAGVYVREAEKHWLQGRPEAALPWMEAAMRTEADDPERERRHREVLHTLLNSCPRLEHAWFLENEMWSPVAASPDGRLIAAASNAGTAMIWDTGTGTPACPPLVHRSDLFQGTPIAGDTWIFDVVFSPDGARLLTTCNDSAHLWNAMSGESIAIMRIPGRSSEIRDATFSADGSLIACANMSGKACVWNTTTGNQVELDHPLAVERIDISADGAYAATTCKDGIARVWNLKSQRIIGEMRHGNVVRHVVFVPEALDRVISVSDEGDMRHWKTDGTLISKIATGDERVYALALHPDGKQVAFTSSTHFVQLWDLDSDVPSKIAGDVDGETETVAYSPDGKHIITGGSGGVRIWDVSGELVNHFATGQTIYSAATVSNSLVATGSADGAIKLIRLPTHRDPLAGRHAIGLSRAGEFVAVVENDNQTVQVYSSESGTPLGKPLVHDFLPQSAGISADGTRILTNRRMETRGHPDAPRGRHGLWNVATGKPLVGGTTHEVVQIQQMNPLVNRGTLVVLPLSKDSLRLIDSSTAKPVGPGLLDKFYQYRAACLSDDGSHYAVGIESTVIRVVNTRTGEILSTGSAMKHRWADSLAFSPDNHLLASVSPAENSLVVWDWRKGVPAFAPLPGGDTSAPVAFHSDKVRIATFFGKSARVWDLAANSPVTRPLPHRHPILWGKFSADGKALLTMDVLCGRYTWDARSGELLNAPAATLHEPKSTPLPSADVLTREAGLVSDSKVERSGGLVPLSRETIREMLQSR